MTAYLLPGVIGLLIGLLLHWTGFSRAAGTRLALGLHRSYALRSALTAVGWAMALTALLCYLAVIDVDEIDVLPLSFGALLGGAILGVSAGLCGFTPVSAFAGLGAGNALEALSVLAGCFAGALLLPSLDGLFIPLQTAEPYAAATLFKVTLDEPWLLSGGFLGQACAGWLLVVAAICIPSPKPVMLTEEEIAAEAEGSPATEESTEAASPETDASPDPETAADDTFVAILEGEEPLIVDTELTDEDDHSSDAEILPDDSDKPVE